MIRNLLLTAFRSLKKNKFFSFLNIAGLAVGMAVFLLITQYVVFERSYENFIPDADNIYRVRLDQYANNELVVSSAENFPGVAPAFKSELPEIESCARLYNLGYKNNVIITNEEAEPEPIAFKHRRFLYADSSFLPMFGYELIAGDPSTALSESHTAVVSETYAKMYFGDDDPVGKTLRLQDDDFNNELVKITGVFEDLPANTHLKFDVLFSYKTLFGRGDWAVGRYDQSWQRKDMYTFIKVAPGTNVDDLESRFPQVVDKYMPGLAEQNRKVVLSLQPLKSIHLHSQLAEEPEPNGDDRIVTFLGLIGIFVLVIAWINYVNLATAKAMERASEVGVRKVMGAMKGQLIRQFLVEAGTINFLAIVLGTLMVILVLPAFNSLSGLELSIQSFMQPWFLALVVALWLFGSLLSGFYPAFVLSSYKPTSVLKGKLRHQKAGIVLRKSLVVVQFMASVALIAGTILVYRQLQFMMSQDIGMNIDQVLVIERPGIAPRDRDAFNSAVDVFRGEAEQIPAVEAVAVSVTIPGKQREYKALAKRYGTSDDELVSLRFNSMDYDFMKVFEMKLLAGRVFSEEFTDVDTTVVISEAAARLLGFKSSEKAIGQTITIPQYQWTAIVVGVVNDYHQESLKASIEPSIFYFTKYGGEFYSLRVKTGNLSETLALVGDAWTKAFPGNPMDYFFLNDYFNRQYENEQKFGKLFLVFAMLAIIIGCLGLFGLSAYSANQRTKEIGVRKVLGSSVGSIFLLLSKDYLLLILIAVIVASPLVYFAMQNWVQSFPYHIAIDPIIFIMAGAIVLLIALLTVSYQTLKAARVNPVESLRYE